MLRPTTPAGLLPFNTLIQTHFYYHFLIPTQPLFINISTTPLNQQTSPPILTHHHSHLASSTLTRFDLLRPPHPNSSSLPLETKVKTRQYLPCPMTCDSIWGIFGEEGGNRPGEPVWEGGGERVGKGRSGEI